MKTFNLPDLGEGLAEAEIREWYVNVGDEVKIDQPLVAMETAKALVDVPSPYAGKIIELHGNANTIVKTGAPLVSFKLDQVISDQFIESVQSDKGSVVGKLETSEKKWEDSAVIAGSTRSKPASGLKIMPAARVLANQMQVDLSQVIPSGPQGQITVQDVKQLIAAQTHAGESLHGVRRVMAQVMQTSHQSIVPVTIIDDADITALSESSEKSDLTLHLLKAISAAVKIEPALNAWFDGEKLERKIFEAVHIGLAMDTPDGLFVPVLKNVENTSLVELREKINQYKKLVKERAIAKNDLQGATISLSNFGTIAGRYATPIIVPPMVAILGCGRSRDVPVVKKSQIQIGKILPLSLTIDHRAVTGGEASRFLRGVIDYLESVK